MFVFVTKPCSNDETKCTTIQGWYTDPGPMLCEIAGANDLALEMRSVHL